MRQIELFYSTTAVDKCLFFHIRNYNYKKLEGRRNVPHKLKLAIETIFILLQNNILLFVQLRSWHQLFYSLIIYSLQKNRIRISLSNRLSMELDQFIWSFFFLLQRECF